MMIEKIGRYEIITELGRGGMATVYQAKDPSFEREVAVKVLPKAFLHDPQFRTRFDREAKTIAALEHAAIVPVYDFGEDDDQPYIVMRYMSGGTLSDKLNNGPLELAEAITIVSRMSQALDAAHEKGIVHRDLKPANILFDHYGNAFLSDFGIARIAESHATLTGGAILGTPAYMSPEQVQGDKDLDGRSDLYSLAIIFYYMLIGNPPFQSTTPGKTMMMHVLEPVPDIIDSLPNLPTSVNTVIQKALAKDPDERFQTTSEFSTSLNSAITEDIPEDETKISSINDEAVVEQLPTVISQESDPAQSTAAVAIPKQNIPATPSSKKPGWLPFAVSGIFIIAILAAAAIMLVTWGRTGSGPLAMLASSTETTVPVDTDIPQPSATSSKAAVSQPDPTDEATEVPASPTSEPASPTPEPSLTPSEAPPSILTAGGADKIAFINDTEIWMMNVDGSNLEQLTNDGSEKMELYWTSDGSALFFISGGCARSIDYESGRIDTITCFETGDLKSFRLSPDNSRVAISLNNELFVIPYDTDKLAEAQYHTHLREISDCPVLTPLMYYGTESSVPVKSARWSNDGNRLAILVIGVEDGNRVDLLRVLDIASCEISPLKLDEFPATRFTIDGYNNSPIIQNYGFNGDYLFSLVGYIRNDGYGDLYIYNTDLHRADNKVNPINGECCYRDPQFSPDGLSMTFAFQPYTSEAETSIYFIPIETFGTGTEYQPISIPDEFFTDLKEHIQPVLRPAINP